MVGDVNVKVNHWCDNTLQYSRLSVSNGGWYLSVLPIVGQYNHAVVDTGWLRGNANMVFVGSNVNTVNISLQ